MEKNKKGPRARIHFRIPINEKQFINFPWPNSTFVVAFYQGLVQLLQFNPGL